MKTIYLLLVFSLFCFFNLEARHIIGGEIRYECLSGGQYEISARLYRDCGSQVASFDNPAIFSIYRAMDSGGYSFIETIFSNVENVSEVPLSADSCAVLPPNLCVEKGDYVFEVTLPLSTESYVVVYQRCCRSTSVSNIVDPSGSGMTVAIEIMPFAQSSCNSSPSFSPLSPVACVLKDMELLHTASDKEDDSLVYEFCSPMQGGGLAGSPDLPGDPGACNGIAPNPACPPPFAPIQFIGPSYSALTPFGGNISIDVNTGMITGGPENIGQYVYGVCVKEYRNGVLLSISRRDVQLNITECDCDLVALNEAKPFTSPKLYPNPAKDHLTLNWAVEETPNELEIGLIDLQGRSSLLPFSQTASGLQISLAHLPSGLYFLQYDLAGQQPITQRFAIAR